MSEETAGHAPDVIAGRSEAVSDGEAPTTEAIKREFSEWLMARRYDDQDRRFDHDELEEAFEAGMEARHKLRMCPGGCGCRLGSDDPDARECGCDGGCNGEDQQAGVSL